MLAQEIAKFFIDEKIVAYPTDTVYGLGCIATSEKAVEKIYKIKKRDKNKPLLVLVKSYCMLKRYFFVSTKQDQFLRTIWQEGMQPTTVILKSRGLLAKNISSDNSVAVRIPVNNKNLISLIKKINLPIIATSLNLSGEKPVENIAKISQDLAKNIDLIVDEGTLKNTPSRILDIRDINNIVVVRE